MAKRSPTIIQYLQIAGRVLVAAVFLIAGLAKIGDPMGLYVEIEHYRLLPETAGRVLAIYLPWLELACGGALLHPRWFKAGACVGVSVMALFSFATLWAWQHDINVVCGCFGFKWDIGETGMLIRNVLIAGVLVACAWPLGDEPVES